MHEAKRKEEIHRQDERELTKGEKKISATREMSEEWNKWIGQDEKDVLE